MTVEFSSSIEALIVMGGQYGSEGKGEIVAYLANKYHPAAVIRTGGPNAGHTMTTDAGTFKMQQIPCAWHVEGVDLAIGPESLIDVEQLAAELKIIEAITGRSPHVYIDPQATVITERDRRVESQLAMNDRIGSTQHGIGAARSERIMRSGPIAKSGEGLDLLEAGLPVGHNVHAVVRIHDLGYPVWLGKAVSPKVIIESTQGYGLSLHASGHYPYTTSADITPGHLMEAAGLSSRHEHRVLAILRTFPIRVAGNSGPMGHMLEDDWTGLHKMNPAIPDAGEITTVTKRVRRIAWFDPMAVRAMAKRVKPDMIAITFMDYLAPTINKVVGDAGAMTTSWGDLMTIPTINPGQTVGGFINDVEDLTGAPVVWISVGPGKIIERNGIVVG